jgi:hypothetical protein
MPPKQLPREYDSLPAQMHGENAIAQLTSLLTPSSTLVGLSLDMWWPLYG